ncbi:RNHCP domain-containing protein [Alicyclobacillus contaminans]|uniref:RNHCP domain-containing protein n=1 Tax=Alicyclobacillus contaminans TaxID=392016 RepID=UPI00047DF7DC|nr:RNHCP domain-containing protein [Alicyclobacillus contaminans]
MGRRFIDRNESFQCGHCGRRVPPSKRSCRNHCPHCLYSVHLDVFPGDRSANCGELMEPVRVEYHSKKGYQIVHRCLRCGHESRNVAALDDELQPDNLEMLLQLMRNG